ncbi:MAG: hypothetical protein J4469_04170 [Candidatus Aenigmarchaeota archaeon]|nr:hypothetical protein [Candidatus Aenigmarchaeota archaeon]
MIDNVSKEEQKVLYQKVIRGLLKDRRLSTWEKEFLASINDQILLRDLSKKQLDTLNKIRQRYPVGKPNV